MKIVEVLLMLIGSYILIEAVFGIVQAKKSRCETFVNKKIPYNNRIAMAIVGFLLIITSFAIIINGPTGDTKISCPYGFLNCL